MTAAVKWDDLIATALAEDLGPGDVTAEVLELAAVPSRGEIIAHDEGVLFGIEAVRRVFARLDRRVWFRPTVEDGQRFSAGKTVAHVSGPAGPILAGERVALNFLQHLSGVATLTAAFVSRANNPGVVILDTRKTTPGLRAAEKAAVRAGGGANHRAGLFDGIMIKDNHKRLVGSIGAAITQARARRRPHVAVFAEVETLAEAAEAAEAGADVIMLDNFELPTVAEAARVIGRRADIEATGGITLANVAAFAGAGVTRISAGALTHSAPAISFSLELRKELTSGG